MEKLSETTIKLAPKLEKMDFIGFSIVIPTRDREKDLLKCIESICQQTFFPLEVLIVDDGKISEQNKELIKNLLLKKGISYRYFKKNKPGTAESRNLGAKESLCDLVLFLDDDVVLNENYIKVLMETWVKHSGDSKVVGISGVPTNGKEKLLLEKIFERVFFLYSSRSWAILPWGFQTWDYKIKKVEIADWLPGGFAIFRKDVFQKYSFSPLQPGRTGLEDVEFCLQLKNKGFYFIITPFAKLIHNESLIGREKAFISGYKRGFNQCLIFKYHSEKNLKNYLCFIIASMGWILRQWIAIFVEPALCTRHFLLSIGLIGGIFSFTWKILWRRK